MKRLYCFWLLIWAFVFVCTAQKPHVTIEYIPLGTNIHLGRTPYVDETFIKTAKNKRTIRIYDKKKQKQLVKIIHQIISQNQVFEAPFFDARVVIVVQQKKYKNFPILLQRGGELKYKGVMYKPDLVLVGFLNVCFDNKSELNPMNIQVGLPAYPLSERGEERIMDSVKAAKLYAILTQNKDAKTDSIINTDCCPFKSLLIMETSLVRTQHFSIAKFHTRLDEGTHYLYYQSPDRLHILEHYDSPQKIMKEINALLVADKTKVPMSQKKQLKQKIKDFSEDWKQNRHE